MLAIQIWRGNIYNYLTNVNCHAQFGNPMTNYDVTINKKGTKDTLQNIISIPLDVTLKMM